MAQVETNTRAEYEELDYDVHFLDAESDVPSAASRSDAALALVAPSYMLFDAQRQLTFWSIRPEDDCVDFARLFHTGLAIEDLWDKAVRLGVLDTEGVEFTKFAADRLSHFMTGESSVQCRMAGGRWFRMTDRRNEDGTTITAIVNVTSSERRERAMAMLIGDMQTGLPLFERAARALTIGLGFQTASVARLIGNDEAETIACLHSGAAMEQRRFSIRGTPCEPVYRAGYFSFSGDFLRRFPLINFDGYFVDIGHGSYLGQVVYDRAGHAIGHVLALDETERQFEEGDRRLVRMVAEHVAFELEHLGSLQAVVSGESRLADFAETAHEAFFETDADLQCTFASLQAEAITGMAADSWVGLPMLELGSALDQGWQTCLAHISEHRAFHGTVFTFGRPGKNSPRLSLSGKPIFDAIGRFSGYRFAALRLPNEQPVISQRLESEETAAPMIGSSMEGVALYNTDYKLIFCNDKFLGLLFGNAQDKVKPGMSLLQLSYLWMQNGAEADKRALIKFHLEPDSLGGDYMDITTPEQRTLRAIRRRTEEGGLATIYLDITDLKRREHELADARDAALEANTTKSMFLANVSHELRTPLNAIIGFAEIMREQLLGPINNPRYFEYVQDIRASGEHLLDMINDILDLSKAEAGELELAFETLDIAEVMNAVVRLMSEQAEAGKLHFVALSPVGLRKIRGDQRRIKQVLINLISNAIKFTPAGGTIEMSARSEKGCVRISINDTGIGIAPEEIERVMVPFGQVDSEISRRHKGTGLGLPLAKKLVEMHGGELVITSESGRGTRVSVSFPFNPAPKAEND